MMTASTVGEKDAFGIDEADVAFSQFVKCCRPQGSAHLTDLRCVVGLTAGLQGLNMDLLADLGNSRTRVGSWSSRFGFAPPRMVCVWLIL
jgi:hypothetical protein